MNSLNAAGRCVEVVARSSDDVEGVSFFKAGGCGTERVRVLVRVLVRELRGVETERSQNFRVLEGVFSTEKSGSFCVEQEAAESTASLLALIVISFNLRFFDGDVGSWQVDTPQPSVSFPPSSSKRFFEAGRAPGFDVFVNRWMPAWCDCERGR